MIREDCWMTFSEALEKYLTLREAAKHFRQGRDREQAVELMEVCADHMDALTSQQED